MFVHFERKVFTGSAHPSLQASVPGPALMPHYSADVYVGDEARGNFSHRTCVLRVYIVISCDVANLDPVSYIPKFNSCLVCFVRDFTLAFSSPRHFLLSASLSPEGKVRQKVGSGISRDAIHTGGSARWGLQIRARSHLARCS